jgi:hypothetical protein
MSKPEKFDPLWAKAKAVCRLNMEDIQMAKELGMKPKSLMKNNPSPSEKWKLPVKTWIHELHEERFGTKPQTGQKSKSPRPIAEEPHIADDNMPF